ncbi:membrane hypothetical protein [Streptomyces misionensis JCM 4497]
MCPWSDKATGQAVCSPRPRGWPRHGVSGLEGVVLLPAPAGLVPRSGPGSRPVPPAPCVCWDGPVPEWPPPATRYSTWMARHIITTGQTFAVTTRGCSVGTVHHAAASITGMAERTAERATGMNPKTEGGAGCLLAGLGATAAPLVWAPRAAVSIDGGFEGHARDLSVLFIDLPLIVLGGALVPLFTWALAARWVHRPWAAALVALATLALALWGLTEWWTPVGSQIPVTDLGSDHRGPRKGAPAGEPADHAIGQSRGGLTTKIHLAADARCRPLAFVLTRGDGPSAVRRRAGRGHCSPRPRG